MKKVLIVTADNTDDSELLYPLYRLQEAGYEPEIASFAVGTVHAKYHFTAEAACDIHTVTPDEYVGLVLPGGLAPEKLRQDPAAPALVRAFHEQGKPICAICHGPQLLISAGILKGVRATCYPGLRDDLINCGALYEDTPAVTDQGIVTSRRPIDLPAFMKAFLALLEQ